jgi:hypothetical protein
MNTKPTIIGAFSCTKKSYGYLHTLGEYVGDSADAILLQYKTKGDTGHVQVPSNTQLVVMDKPYAGNTGKHRDLAKVIPTIKDWRPDDWVIVTDVHDVVFQAPIPELPNNTILTSCEGKTFGEIDFWRDRLPFDYHNWIAYNVGTFAIKYRLLEMFWGKLETRWMEFFDWYKNGMVHMVQDGFPFDTIQFEKEVKEVAAVTFNSYFDTLIFNEFIRLKLDVKEAPWLFGVYAYEYETRRVTIKDSKMYRDKQLLPISHYNGDSKAVMPQIVSL